VRVLVIHSRFRERSGVESVVDTTIRLLRRKGVEAVLLTRDHGVSGLPRRAAAALEGFYSISGYKLVCRAVSLHRPDVVHVHNLFPFFSPSALTACRRCGVPVVMTLHSLRLECPAGRSVREELDCRACWGGREYRCVLHNCRGSLPASFIYGLRAWTARHSGSFRDNVSMFIVLAEFARRRLVEAGFSDRDIMVIPNTVDAPDSVADPATGMYCAYAGRLRPEKGVQILLAAAARLPDVPIWLAGDGGRIARLGMALPRNVRMLGRLDPSSLGDFYRGARLAVVPSFCQDLGPMVALEAMAHGLPLIASRVGGLREMVVDGVTGLFVARGDPQDLAEKMKLLWQNPSLCRRMGAAARRRVLRAYGVEQYFRRLMAAYREAILRGAVRRPFERFRDQRFASPDEQNRVSAAGL